MAPIKFEDNLKDTLEKRTIQPSKGAWNKLENKLNQNSSGRSKQYWIWGLAASVIGVLLVTSLFFKGEIEPVKSEIKVVHEKPITEKQIVTETSKATEEKDGEPEMKKENTVFEPSTQIASETSLKNKPVIPEIVVEQSLVEDLTQISETHNELEQFKNYEDAKVNEVVAHVKELVKKNQSVTQEEIDSLLAIAQKDLKRQKIYNQTTGKVDAMALLEDVENDLDKSFRDKVFDALYSGIENVATAIAQRNE